MISQDICHLLSDLPHVLRLSLGSSMVLQRAVFHSFPCRIFHCVHGPLLLCAFICWWTFWFLPTLGYAKYWCSAGLPACVFWILVFSGDRPSSGPTRSYGSLIFTFKRTSILFSLLAVTTWHLTSNERVHSPLKPLQHLLFVDFLLMAFGVLGGDTFV